MGIVEGTSAARPIRILTVVEATSVDGIVKPLFEFLREVRRPDAVPHIEVSAATFVRGVPDNLFIRAARAEGLPLDIIREARRFDFRVVEGLREAIRRRRPDVLWTHNVKSHFLTRFAGLHRDVPWVASHHGYTTTTWLMRLYNQLNRWSLPAARSVLTVCCPFADQLVASGVQRDRITVLHTPIRTVLPEPSPGHKVREELGINGTVRIVLSVGRLSREKGHSTLLRAVAHMRRDPLCPPIRLLLVGDGPEKELLRSLAQRLGLSDVVVLCGHRADVRAYYSAADVFVLPSHTEGSPNVLLEAMDAGVPVVATRVGGIPEMVEHGRTALLVERGDASEMGSQILRALRDTELRGFMVAAAREAVAAHGPEDYFNRLAEVFQRVAAGLP